MFIENDIEKRQKEESHSIVKRKTNKQVYFTKKSSYFNRQVSINLKVMPLNNAPHMQLYFFLHGSVCLLMVRQKLLSPLDPNLKIKNGLFYLLSSNKQFAVLSQ